MKYSDKIYTETINTLNSINMKDTTKGSYKLISITILITFGLMIFDSFTTGVKYETVVLMFTLITLFIVTIQLVKIMKNKSNEKIISLLVLNTYLLTIIKENIDEFDSQILEKTFEKVKEIKNN